MTRLTAMARLIGFGAVSATMLGIALPPLAGQEMKPAAEKAAKTEAAKPEGAPRLTASTISDSSPADIQRWIKQLNDDQFLVRETATEELIKAGEPCIEPLRKAATTEGLEVAVRAIHVFSELGLSDDVAAAGAARVALEDLADSKTAAVRDRADGALETLDRLEAPRAMKKIEDSGGYLGSPEYAGPGQALVPLVISEGKWTGGDDGLKQLCFLRDIEMVSVRCRITDDAVEHLSKLKHLTALKLYSTDISDEGLEKIKAALPGVTVDIRGGQLGISSDLVGGGRCQVKTVMKNTAADKAGLQPGDIVVKCDGKPIETFANLVDMMRVKRVGTKVKLEIQRPRADGTEETLEPELTLGVWRDLSDEGVQVPPDPKKE